MTTLAEICSDLADEQRSLDTIVEPLEPASWDAATPSPGWTVRDQVSHLAFFEETAAQAASDVEGFKSQLSAIASDPGSYMDIAIDKGRSIEPAAVLEWWREARSRALEVFQRLDPDVRVPWFGPSMKPVSFVTARLMETWAHGQDVDDALGVERAATDRLKHVAHIGVRARSFSFHINGQEPPHDDVSVELDSPTGDKWSWGSSSTDLVRGPALDFCLVVTQRRHLHDTDLEIEGPVAGSWMRIAQAFAGPPGEGRKPGQFAKPSTR
jgi:uncharacterized protein (TIGR03084 family)